MPPTNKILLLEDGHIYRPLEGTVTGQVPTWNDTTNVWTAAALPSTPYDFSGEVPGTAADTDEVFHFVAVRSFTIKGGAAGQESRAQAKSIPAGTAVYTVTKNGTQIATITMTSASISSIISIDSGTDKVIAAGDYIVITATSGAANVDTLYFTFFAVV